MSYERVQTDPPLPDAKPSQMRSERRDMRTRAEKRVQTAPAPARYKAVTGITYPDGPDNIELAEAGELEYVTNWIHLEPGDDASDVPECDVSWLLKQGHIKVVTDRV